MDQNGCYSLWALEVEAEIFSSIFIRLLTAYFCFSHLRMFRVLILFYKFTLSMLLRHRSYFLNCSENGGKICILTSPHLQNLTRISFWCTHRTFFFLSYRSLQSEQISVITYTYIVNYSTLIKRHEARFSNLRLNYFFIFFFYLNVKNNFLSHICKGVKSNLVSSG